MPYLISLNSWTGSRFWSPLHTALPETFYNFSTFVFLEIVFWNTIIYIFSYQPHYCESLPLFRHQEALPFIENRMPEKLERDTCIGLGPNCYNSQVLDAILSQSLKTKRVIYWQGRNTFSTKNLLYALYADGGLRNCTKMVQEANI